MKKVLTYGTFDLLHVGHINLLRRACSLGNHLTVGLSTDDFNRIKHKDVLIPYAERHQILESIRYVDAIIAETCWEQKLEDVRNHNIDIFVMGDDWEGKFDFLKSQCQVVYLPRTPGISTTQLKQRLSITND